MNENKKLIPTIVIVLVAVVFGSTSAYAEKAIPGDPLYGMKVNINEKVAGVFSITKEEKAEWQERLVERRLDEATKLVSDNKFTEKERVILENQIKSQIEVFSTNVKELSLKSSESITSKDLNTRLQASLQAYKSVLDTLSTNNTINADTKSQAVILLTTIDSGSVIANDNKIEMASTTVDTGVDSASALTKKADASSALSSVKLLYQKDKLKLSLTKQKEIDSNLAVAENYILEGDKYITSGDYTNAISKYTSAISTIDEIQLSLVSNVIKGDIEDDIGVGRNHEDDDDDEEEYDD